MPVISGNTSATGGPLAPSSLAPADDLDLDVILQVVIAGLTGLPREHVLPRWQETQPRIPDVGTNWCAVGVIEEAPFDTPALIHNGAGDGSSILRGTSRLEVLASFYGPKSNGYARLVADMLWVGQNREFLLTNGLSLRDVGTLRRVPEIIGMQPRRKTDLPITLTRVYDRTLPILNVRQAVGALIAADVGVTSPSVTTEPFAIPETP
ncbi:phage neck terminator protein [Methylobacterium komagatae]